MANWRWRLYHEGCFPPVQSWAVSLLRDKTPVDVWCMLLWIEPMSLAQNPGMCSFSWIFAKFQWAPNFAEFVLGGFLCFFRVFFNSIAYSNFTFCGTWTVSLFAFRWKMWKFQETSISMFSFIMWHCIVKRNVWMSLFYKNKAGSKHC